MCDGSYRLRSTGAAVPTSRVILAIRALSWVAGEFLRNPKLNPTLCLVGNESREVDDSHMAILTFDSLPRLGAGSVLGSDHKTCDITLSVPGKKMSAKHLVVCFDGNGQLIMQDWSSLGTHVSYDPQDGFFHRAWTQEKGPFTWVLPPGWPVQVNVGSVELEMLVPNHSDHLSEYRDSVEAFRAAAIPGTGTEQTPAGGQTPVGPWTDDGGRLARLQHATQPLGVGAGKTAGLRPATIAGVVDGGGAGPALDESYGRAAFIKDKALPLGKGGNGEVSKYRDASTWLLYAGKTPLHGSLDWEVDLMKRHTHDHIVKFVDSIDDHVLIMEYCGEGSLYHLLRDRPLTELESLTILQQSLQAVAYLHERGVAHRDLTPSNILFRSVDPVDIALADFGWAKETDVSMVTIRAGTMNYRAPELFMGRGTYRPSVDIWSLGILAGQCLLGLSLHSSDRNMTEAENAFAILDHVTGCMVHFAADKPYTPLIWDMLCWTASERPTAEECLRRLDAILASHIPGSQTFPTAGDGTINPGLLQPTRQAGPKSPNLDLRDFIRSEYWSSRKLEDKETQSQPKTAIRMPGLDTPRPNSPGDDDSDDNNDDVSKDNGNDDGKDDNENGSEDESENDSEDDSEDDDGKAYVVRSDAPPPSSASHLHGHQSDEAVVPRTPADPITSRKRPAADSGSSSRDSNDAAAEPVSAKRRSMAR